MTTHNLIVAWDKWNCKEISGDDFCNIFYSMFKIEIEKFIAEKIRKKESDKVVRQHYQRWEGIKLGLTEDGKMSPEVQVCAWNLEEREDIFMVLDILYYLRVTKDLDFAEAIIMADNIRDRYPNRWNQIKKEVNEK